MGQIIMSWSKCRFEIAPTGENDAPAELVDLVTLGTIKDKSASLSAENGDTLEMKATGGELVGYEQQEGTLTATATVIEPSAEMYQLLGIGKVGENGELEVSSHTIGKEFTLRITPKNIGAKGIIAPKCSISVQPAWDEENGHSLVFTFGILKSQVLKYWYKKFTTTTAL